MILVDKIREYPNVRGRAARYGTRWCHMVTDADTFDELHDMAKRIGLSRAWFQGDHYDLVPVRRERAVRAGAVECDAREFARRRLHANGSHNPHGILP